jgi:protein TonB
MAWNWQHHSHLRGRVGSECIHSRQGCTPDESEAFMPSRFFEQLLDSNWQKQPKAKRSLTLPVSIAVHVVVLAAVVVVPLMSWGELPEPDEGVVRAFFVDQTLAPPPPPPPPAPPKAAAQPRVQRPKVKVETPTEAPKFTAPIEVPPKIEDPGVDLGGSELGVPGGEPGGVEGGTIGGVEGGTIGGVVGGVVGGIPEAPPPPPPPPTPEPAPKGPVRVGGQIKEPTKIRNVPPVYPEVAKQARVQGVVVLEAVISPAGEVTNVKVLRGSPLLDDAAVSAVKQWRYSPTTLNGQPVAVVMTVTVNFRMGD